MSQQIRAVFEKRKATNEPALITFITAGYPTVDATVDLLLDMERGGADIIELGLPFSDPMADGPTIQATNLVALEQNVTYATCCDFVAQARARGLKTPVLFMGYYNTILAQTDERAVQLAKAAGVNGFIVVDLPPEEAASFCTVCTAEGLSYIPLIAPSTTDARITFLSSIADSFIYVVSRMGTTGARSEVSADIGSMLGRIRKLTVRDIPLAVGFGVSSRDIFTSVGAAADGVVIGSQIANVIKSGGSTYEFCREVGRDRVRAGENGAAQAAPIAPEAASAAPGAATAPAVSAAPSAPVESSLPPYFGQFGGAFVPEALKESIDELTAAYEAAKADPAFQAEWLSEFGYINRPSQLYHAKRLTEFAGGAQIWLKREDLNHTGSHKINNAIGQILLARRLGKTRIICETGAGQHGVATATACAKFGLECIVYMGAEDVRRQSLNVFRIRMLGAQVVAVTSGTQTLKDAVNEAMRDWVTNLSTTHYLIGSAVGPHPFPTIVRDFQSVIGSEIKEQMQAATGRLPDAVVACVGGGSNAIGTFHPFIKDTSVRIVGVEAAGEGTDTTRHAATLGKGTPGVFHGVRSFVLQTDDGQIVGTHSISAGLDYPGVGPEHSWLKDTKRAEYIACKDEDALRGFRYLTQKEGIIPALESSHAVFAGIELAKTLPSDANIVITCSGRGDKDVQEIAELLPVFGDRIDWHIKDPKTSD